MSTLTDRLTAAAAVTEKPRRVSIMPFLAIAMAVSLAGLAYGGLPQTASGFAKEAIARVSAEHRGLDERWQGARNPSVPRGTSWRVECISDYDPYWEAREIADRVEAGERVIVGCLQARFVR
jgi:hypothetical protein